MKRIFTAGLAILIGLSLLHQPTPAKQRKPRAPQSKKAPTSKPALAVINNPTPSPSTPKLIIRATETKASKEDKEGPAQWDEKVKWSKPLHGLKVAAQTRVVNANRRQALVAAHNMRSEHEIIDEQGVRLKDLTEDGALPNRPQPRRGAKKLVMAGALCALIIFAAMAGYFLLRGKDVQVKASRRSADKILM